VKVKMNTKQTLKKLTYTMSCNQFTVKTWPVLAGIDLTCFTRCLKAQPIGVQSMHSLTSRPVFYPWMYKPSCICTFLTWKCYTNSGRLTALTPQIPTNYLMQLVLAIILCTNIVNFRRFGRSVNVNSSKRSIPVIHCLASCYQLTCVRGTCR